MYRNRVEYGIVYFFFNSNFEISYTRPVRPPVPGTSNLEVQYDEEGQKMNTTVVLYAHTVSCVNLNISCVKQPIYFVFNI